MFGWLQSKLRRENDRLRAEVVALKAAMESPQQLVADGGSGLPAPQANLSAHREQLRHFTGHVFTAVSAIAKRVAGQELFVSSDRVTRRPLNTTKAMGNGLEPLPFHAMLDAINDPNDVMVRWSLLYITVASLELTGKAYWWLRDSGERLEIWPLPSDWVEPVHGERLYAQWKVRPAGAAEPFTLDGDEVAYFHLPDPADPLGAVSPLQAQAKAVDADENILDAQSAAFRNGVAPSVAITVGGVGPNPTTGKTERPELTDVQRQELIQAVRRAYSGVFRRGEPLILDRLIEAIEPLSNKPAEMDFLDSGKATKSRIFEAFGVNPIVVGQVESANRASSWVAEHHFCEGVVNPLLTLLGQVLTSWVAPRFALPGETLTVWFAPCVAHDAELDLMKWRIAAQYQLVTKDEFRRHVLNLPDLPDGDGSELVVAPVSPKDFEGFVVRGWQDHGGYNAYAFADDERTAKGA